MTRRDSGHAAEKLQILFFVVVVVIIVVSPPSVAALLPVETVTQASDSGASALNHRLLGCLQKHCHSDSACLRRAPPTTHSRHARFREGCLPPSCQPNLAGFLRLVSSMDRSVRGTWVGQGKAFFPHYVRRDRFPFRAPCYQTLALPRLVPHSHRNDESHVLPYVYSIAKHPI